MKNKISITFLLAFLLMTSTAKATITYQTIDLTGHIVPISNNLSTYMGVLNRPLSEPFVGFNGTNIGYGLGDGINEAVPFSFYYQPVKTSAGISATLTLTLIFSYDAPDTDALMFAQQGDHTIYYGNKEIVDALQRCGINKICYVTFDLRHISATTGPSHSTYLGIKDLSNLVQGGQLDVVYVDDAKVIAAKLKISAVPASPTPPLPTLH